MDTPAALHVQTRGRVRVLTLNRPSRLNAIDNPMAEALLAALQAAAADQTVGAVHLRGQGRAFCAGRDVGAAPTDRDLVLVQGVAQALVRCPKPVLAEVHGWTVGAGLEWMLCADLVLAGDDTRFKLPEAALGVFVTGGLSATLPAAVGLMRAKALVLLGEVFDARQALDWGLVSRVVADDDRAAAASAMAAALASLAPAVAARFKQVFNTLGLAGFDRAIEAENAAQRALAEAIGPAHTPRPGDPP